MTIKKTKYIYIADIEEKQNRVKAMSCIFFIIISSLLFHHFIIMKTQEMLIRGPWAWSGEEVCPGEKCILEQIRDFVVWFSNSVKCQYGPPWRSWHLFHFFGLVSEKLGPCQKVIFGEEPAQSSLNGNFALNYMFLAEAHGNSAATWQNLERQLAIICWWEIILKCQDISNGFCTYLKI